MTSSSSPWVILDERPLGAEAVASAIASQAPLGALLERLREVRYRQLPVPPAGEEVAP